MFIICLQHCNQKLLAEEFKNCDTFQWQHGFWAKELYILQRLAYKKVIISQAESVRLNIINIVIDIPKKTKFLVT